MTSKSNPVTLETLHKRQTEQEREVSELRAKRSDAILEGHAFDKSKLHDAEDELVAIDEAIAEFKRREEDRLIAEAEAEAAKTKQERLECAIAGVHEKMAQREAAIENAEVAARAFAAAIAEAEKCRQSLAVETQTHLGVMPLGLMPCGQEDRMSKAFSAVVATAIGKGNFGDIKLHPGLKDAEQVWLAAETFVTRDVEAAIAARE